MIKNKIMNLLRKGNDTMKLRKMAMVFAVASMALVGGVACGVSDKDTAKTEKVEIAENTENNKEESSVEETTEEVVEETTTKEEVKETTKEEVKKEQTKEEVKKEQTSNTDKKKEENVKTEKPSKGNSNNTSSANKPSTGNGTTTTNSVNKPSTGNGTTNKPSTGNSNNNSPNTNKPSNSGANIKPSTPAKPVHTHTWEEVTTTVYHEEQGHYENVVVKEAWTETKPKYETQERAICNGCGKDITSNPGKHMKEQMLAGIIECGGWHSEYKQVQVGTEAINHPAVTERKWVIDKPAWTEKVVTGHKCSGCGATK